MIWPKKFYLILLFLFSRTTPRFWQRLQNRVVSYLVFRMGHRLRHLVQQNLSVILHRPVCDPLVVISARQTLKNYGLYLVDYAQLNRLRPYLIPRQRGTHFMQQALKQGRGAILITPHLGHWELGGVTFAMRGTPIHALTLKDPQTGVQSYRDRMRATLGIESLHIDPANTATVIKLAGLLRNNQVIAMLGDRYEGGKKVAVQFFDRNVYFPAGAAALALVTGAPIIPAFTVLEPDGRYLAWMDAPIRVSRVSGRDHQQQIASRTQAIASTFEAAIRRYPDQFYHFFNYWDRYAVENPAH